MAEPQPSPTTLSATDERRFRANPPAPPPPAEEVPFATLTPRGYEPFFPPPDSQPPDSPEAHRTENDNPFNPKGGPSLSLPQQATPLTSQQDVLAPDEMLDDKLYRDIVSTQDGLAPDDPRNPRGTPDYIIEEPSPQSNPDDQQHDGRTSLEQTEPVTEPAKYWEGGENG